MAKQKTAPAPTANLSNNLKIANTLLELANWRSEVATQAKTDKKMTVGLVPTMGALHEGHMTLIKRARSECRQVAVSIFVNPLQFGPNEDFEKYPRVFEKDVELCKAAGVDLIFHPSVDEIYPAGQQDTTKVIPPTELTTGLCGAFRLGHFVGVATIVSKLFNLVQPDVAYFGEKDYQQLTIIRKMAIDLNIPANIIGVPTVREKDGLAMSSRNVYLNPAQRALAPALYEILNFVKDEIVVKKTPVEEALIQGRFKIQGLPGVNLQYLECCEANTLERLTELKLPLVILVAAKFGDVRLIDNIIARS